MEKKRILCLILTAVMLASMMTALVINSSAAVSISVTTATSTESTSLSSLSVPSSGLFCGWYTTEAAAMALDGENVAKDGYAGTVYGATVSLSGKISVDGVQMRTEAPTGVRFLATISKDIIDAVESLNVLNCRGKNGSFTPSNETKTNIGYGMVLAIDTETDGSLVKVFGDNVKNGMTVPGVYTYSETSSSVTYTATVIGVDTAAVADKIAVRPYITYADANGNTRTVYYTESGKENGAYAASLYEVASLVINDENATEEAKTAAQSLLTTYTGSTYTSKSKIDAFNTDAEEGTADNDIAYVEFDRSSLVTLYTTAASGNNTRWKNSFYPRVTKVRDNFYVMTLQYGQEGQHIYYSISTDKGKTWSDPTVMYNANAAANKIEYTTGSLAGTTDTYFAATADHCLLDDGTILCVYSRRPCIGYNLKEYTAMSTLEVVRGTVVGNTLTWSEPKTVYYGQNWEPEIIQRKNGQIDIYWTHIAPMLYLYGFHDDFRSSGVAMISSTDNGETWTPNVTSTSAPFAAKRIFQMSAGNYQTTSGAVVPFMHCQMPGVVELVNGKMMIVSEARKIGESSHQIAKGYSEAGGEWEELAIDEQGPWNTRFEIFKGAAPSLMRFTSGEVLMTYNYSSNAYCRLMNDNATNMLDSYALNVFGVTNATAGGFWSGSTLIDSHTALIYMTHTRFEDRTYTKDETTGKEVFDNTNVIGKVRLNHTINATKKNVVADGNFQEWSNINEALFVGSLTAKAQATYRFAYDEDYVYVAVDRTDSSNNKDDTVVVRMTTSSGYVTAKMSYNTEEPIALPAGVTGATKNASGGRTFEFAFDRAALGITGDYIRVCPGLTDVDAGTSEDIITGMSRTDTTTWIKVNLK